MERHWMIGALAAAAFAATAWAGPGMAAPSVEIRNAAARVVVIPEARSDVVAQLVITNGSLPLEVRQEGERIIIDGGLSRRVEGCSSMFGKTTVRIRGLGQVAYDILPQILIRTPMDTKVFAGGAVFGSVGRADTLDL